MQSSCPIEPRLRYLRSRQIRGEFEVWNLFPGVAGIVCECTTNIAPVGPVYALLWTVLLLAVAISINVIGIRVLGSIERWEHWMEDHMGYFLTWHLLLCAVIGLP